MIGRGFEPHRTLAVVLGASAWPLYSGFQSSPAFRNSAEAVRDYLLASSGLGLPGRNVKFLFDSHDDPPGILDEIMRFSRERIEVLGNRGEDVTDIVVYYVGHGGFANPSSDYFLALRSTRTVDPYLSSLPIISLARTLNEVGRHLRRYLILDCCFAAAAYKTFQADGPLSVAAVKVTDAFPPSGTALLCASGAKDPAKAPADLDRTMFTGALLSVLEEGDRASPPLLSLQDVGYLVRQRILQTFATEGVRPEVLVPEQRHGRVDEIPIFPNRQNLEKARTAEVEEAAQRAEDEQRRAEGAKAQEEKRLRAERAARLADEERRHAEQAEMKEQEQKPEDADQTLEKEKLRDQTESADKWAAVGEASREEVELAPERRGEQLRILILLALVISTLAIVGTYL